MNAAAAAVVVLNGRQAFDPRATLFAHNEPGTWYDASDLGTMFTDSAGTTPVTAVEQAVGLILDKSRGAALQDNIVVNGDFTSSTGWVLPGNWTISGGSANATGVGYMYRALSALAGTRVFRVDFEVTAYTSGTVQAYVHNGSSAVFTAAASALGKYSQLIVHSGVNELGFLANTFTGSVDNLVIREIAGTHAIQPTAASRPVLRNRYNLLTYSEQFDDAAWNKGNSTVTANTSVAPDGTTTADTFTSTAGSAQHYLQPGAGASVDAINVNYTGSISFKSGTHNFVTITYSGGSSDSWSAVTVDLSTGLITKTGNGATGTLVSSSISSQGNGWHKITLTASYSPGASGIYLWVSSNSSGTPTYGGYGMETWTAAGTETILVWGADLRRTIDTIYPYQRIEAATVYDSDASKFPLYLACDGSDDSLYTAANLDLSSTDKVTVFAGVTKLSDAAFGAIAELTANAASNNGSFYLVAGGGAGSLGALYGGAINGSALYAADFPTFTAPVTNAITQQMDIALATGADELTLRGDGIAATRSTTAGTNAGTGNFASAVLYIGRRNNASLPLNGRIYQLIVRGAASSAAEISSTERYIAGKQGRSL
jgi:hypothetical protein